MDNIGLSATPEPYISEVERYLYESMSTPEGRSRILDSPIEVMYSTLDEWTALVREQKASS